MLLHSFVLLSFLKLNRHFVVASEDTVQYDGADDDYPIGSGATMIGSGDESENNSSSSDRLYRPYQQNYWYNHQHSYFHPPQQQQEVYNGYPQQQQQSYNGYPQQQQQAADNTVTQRPTLTNAHCGRRLTVALPVTPTKSTVFSSHRRPPPAGRFIGIRSSQNKVYSPKDGGNGDDDYQASAEEENDVRETGNDVEEHENDVEEHENIEKDTEGEIDDYSDTQETTQSLEPFDAEDVRIVGGNITTINQWPWQVTLKSFKVHLCGGTLISDRFVVSAAHCFTRYSDPAYFSVFLGKSKKSPNDVEQGQIESEISAIHIHPKYSQKTHDNDIALIRLKNPVQFTENILPACLPRRGSAIPDGSTCYVSGFGETKHSGGENLLKVAEVGIIPEEHCKRLGKKFRRILTPNMICAGHLAGGIDACQGDSGGPVVCTQNQTPQTFTLYGVVSFGWGCALKNSPGVYAKVASYLPFIQASMRKNPSTY